MMWFAPEYSPYVKFWIKGFLDTVLIEVRNTGILGTDSREALYSWIPQHGPY